MRRKLAAVLLSLSVGLVGLGFLAGPADAQEPPICTASSNLVLLNPTITQVNGRSYASGGQWACVTQLPAGVPQCSPPEMLAVVAGQGAFCVTVLEEGQSPPAPEVSLVDCALAPDGQCLVGRLNQTLNLLLWGTTT